MNTETLTTSLQKSGLRITPQRIAICKFLAESAWHPTAFEIYEQIKREYPSLSLATVYNTLDVLAAQRVINVLGDSGDGRNHFDADTSPHINLACVQCHQITDVEYELLAKIEQELSSSSGFNLLGARVLYYGICPACQKKAAGSS